MELIIFFEIYFYKQHAPTEQNEKHILKTDIKKYFPSIDHGILFEKIKGKIKCKAKHVDTYGLRKEIFDRIIFRDGSF